MKFSFQWLKELTGLKWSAKKMAEALTLHSFEAHVGKRIGADTALDIDVLPNRAHDALSHVGIARELVAIAGKRGIRQKQFSFRESKEAASDSLEVAFEGINTFPSRSARQRGVVPVGFMPLWVQCPRYSARLLTNIHVGPSPKWLVARLATCGVQSINNVVDAANYIMLETGQPLHTFDAEKIALGKGLKHRIVVRMSRPKEKLTTIDGRDLLLPEGTIVIADAKKPLAVAGIKGGVGSEITKQTTHVIVESANFDPISVRKASAALNLTTDASTRFSAGLTPELTVIALDRIAGLLGQLAEGVVAKGVVDVYPKRVVRRKVAFASERVNEVSGAEFQQKEIRETLERAGFEVQPHSFARGLVKLLTIAKKTMGHAQYKYGASVTFDAPRYFDCSSFVSWLYRHIGVRLPRMSHEQAAVGMPVSLRALQAGDLIFTAGAHNRPSPNIARGVGHVGIYVGKGKVISAREKGVVIEGLKQFTKKGFRAARRIIGSGAKADLLVTVPFERLDIESEIDLVEEVVRFRGLAKLVAVPPRALTLLPPLNERVAWAQTIKDAFVAGGFWEAYTNSFVEEDDFLRFGIDPAKEGVLLENPVSMNMAYLRPSLIPNLLKMLAKNAEAKAPSRFFELGARWHKAGKNIKEQVTIAGVVGARQEGTGSFYELKGAVEVACERLGITDLWYDDWKPQTEGYGAKAWQQRETAEIRIGNIRAGVVGRIDRKLADAYGFGGSALYAFELDFDSLSEMASEEVEYRPVSKFPAVVRDVAVLVPQVVSVEMVQAEIERAGGKLLVDTDLFDMYEGEHLDAAQKSLAFHLVFQSDKRTLTDKEVDVAMRAVERRFTARGWELRE